MIEYEIKLITYKYIFLGDNKYLINNIYIY